MNPEGRGSAGGPPCYYSVLGIRRNAPASEVRAAYRKLAMKWHPDRWTKDPSAAAEAKRRFQRIQEAYSVLSDEGKRTMYDVGMYDPLDDQDESPGGGIPQGFSDFMQEMLSMMDNVKPQEESFEDLQRMFVDLVDGMDFAGPSSLETCKKSSSRESRAAGVTGAAAGSVRNKPTTSTSFEKGTVSC